ncbi:GM2A [Cordylochernes scorpioides]|uniref:GM2A n=1 Tax=Cordylochernes scorpioides TaxID=51811 RepID=A0ABY6LJS3_9ARAC|nr:GM2A [Cordylochernes scorpioides]
MVSLVMMKKIPLLFGYSTWLTVPCLPHNIGSCDYGDLCDSPLFRSCAESCGCPFSEGSHRIPPAEFTIPEPPLDLPGYLMEGEFHVKATIARAGSPTAACYAASVDLRM